MLCSWKTPIQGFCFSACGGKKWEMCRCKPGLKEQVCASPVCFWWICALGGWVGVGWGGSFTPLTNESPRLRLRTSRLWTLAWQRSVVGCSMTETRHWSKGSRYFTSGFKYHWGVNPKTSTVNQFWICVKGMSLYTHRNRIISMGTYFWEKNKKINGKIDQQCIYTHNSLSY